MVRRLSADLQNYFTANYPASALGNNVTVTPSPSNEDLSQTTVTYTASSTVPMTFMQLVGINNLTVTVTAQDAAGNTIGARLDAMAANCASLRIDHRERGVIGGVDLLLIMASAVQQPDLLV